MDITIGFLAVLMRQKGLVEDASVALIMGVLAVFSLGILIWFVRLVKPVE